MRDTPRFLDDAPAAPPPPEPAVTPPRRGTPLLLEARPDAAAAVGADWNPVALAPGRGGLGSTFFALAGLGLILGSWLVLAALGSALTLLGQSAELGGVALGLYALGALLLSYAGLREWLSLRRLHQVDRLRAALHAPAADVATARGLCARWLDRVAPRLPEAVPAAAALAAADDLPQLRAMLRNHLQEPLSAATRRIGVKAATEVSALIAVSPHQSWDGLIVAWRGLRLIRQIAQLHGLRPGPAVSLALLGRVGRAAVETAAVDVVSQAAADHVLGNVPLVKHLSAIPAVSTAALRLYRLANVAARACSPLAE